jgi:hypothetical protein
MRVPTVKVRCRETGRIMVINEVDWAFGSIPGVDMGGWDRIRETHGDGDEAVAAAKAQRELVERQIPKGEKLDAKSKPKSNPSEVPPTTRKKTVTKKKTATKKTTRKKTQK